MDVEELNRDCGGDDRHGDDCDGVAHGVLEAIRHDVADEHGDEAGEGNDRGHRGEQGDDGAAEEVDSRVEQDSRVQGSEYLFV